MKLDNLHGSLSRPNLVELVMDKVQAWIKSGEFQPGEKLPTEKEMSEHFRVSRSVIREAVSRLNAIKVIKTYQGRGSFVTGEIAESLSTEKGQPPDESFSQELWELRLILEPAVARLAAELRNSNDLEKLSTVIDSMESALKVGESGVREDDLFHLYLVQATHNRLIERFASNMAKMAEPYKRLSLDQPFRPAATYGELCQIIKAVASQEPDLAYQAMHHHIMMSMASVKERSFPALTQME